MITTLCTIGFAGKTAEEFFSLLTQAGVKRLIDIRENRHGQLSGFAKYPDLSFFLHEIAGSLGLLNRWNLMEYWPSFAPNQDPRSVTEG